MEPKAAVAAPSFKPPSRQIPVSLGKASLRIRLEAYYSLIAPTTLTNRSEWLAKFDQIYEKYGGTHAGEQKLASKLSKKYGTNVRLLLAKSVMLQDRSDTTKKSVNNNSQKRSEEWYELEGQFESGNLNALSPTFDPWSVLNDRSEDVYQVNPWMQESGSNSTILDNVDKFAFFLPLEDPQHRVANMKRGSSMSSKEKQTAELGGSGGNTIRTKTVHPFDVIMQLLDSGPISVLHRLRKKRVTVVVRYVNAIRGTLTGTLLAFDKHMNMILREVVEVYSPRPMNTDHERSNLELELERRRNATSDDDNPGRHESIDGDLRGSGDTPATNTREMKQLLVRGDMIVSVYEASP